MRGRSDGQKINDHCLVISGDLVIDVPRPVRRPMPVKCAALRRASIPVPFDRLPQMRDPRIEISFSIVRTIEILPCGQQTLHQECGFYYIAAIVEHIEDGKAL